MGWNQIDALPVRKDAYIYKTDCISAKKSLSILINRRIFVLITKSGVHNRFNQDDIAVITDVREKA